MLRANRLSELVHHYIARANTGKRGSCHLFRHTMASLLLEGGVDIRHIQAMLGHAHLSTTAIYTRVALMQLKAAHARAHPAERPERTPILPHAAERRRAIVIDD
jgi:integrase/recombinase XerD